MSDLHARLTARIDELERLTDIAAKDSGSKRWVSRMMGGAPPDVAEHIARWDPSTVLRGLAEDRDILARHQVRPRRYYREKTRTACDCGQIVARDCPEVLSVARRHGIEVQS